MENKRNKNQEKCNVVFNSVHISNSKDWYFDSGKFSLVCEIRRKQDRTFGNVVKGKVIRKWNINWTGALILNDIISVEGLFANLISISQLCDQGFTLYFSKDKYGVLDSKKHTTMTGTRLIDNYNHRDNDLKNLKCNLPKSNETMLWHKQLGHWVYLKSAILWRLILFTEYLC